MKQHLRVAAIAALSFAFGLMVPHLPLAARAAAALTPEAVDLLAIAPDAMPTPTAMFPNLRTKTLVVTDGMTAALQMGTAPKHFHAGSNEVQIVLQGTGTEWLGDRRVDLRPGMFIVIPAGTAHAGLVDTSAGMLRFVSFKTPPQAPDDVHFMK